MSTNSMDIKDTASEPSWLRSVRNALRGPRDRSVEVVVHEGRVVQIEETDS